MTREELIIYLDQQYDFGNQEFWDWCGIFWLNKVNISEQVTKIVLALDLTNEVIENAIKLCANVIITHHPILVGNFLEHPNSKWINQVINKLNEANILHICLHTCYDRHPTGTSFQILQKLNFINPTKIDRILNSNYSLSFQLPTPIPLKKFLKLLAKNKKFSRLNTPEKFLNKSIENVAICGGSGFSEIENVLNNNLKIDCFLTGDIKWHNYVDAIESNIAVVDISHSAEWWILDDIKTTILSFEPNQEFIKQKPTKIVSYKTKFVD